MASKRTLTPQNRMLLIAVSALNALGPFHQHFALQNYAIQYPFAVHERVPVVLLYFVAVVCPAAIIAVYTLVIDGIFSHQKHDLPQEMVGGPSAGDIGLRIDHGSSIAGYSA